MVRRSLVVCALVSWVVDVTAAQPPPSQSAADAELLEFLGSLDDEEEGWQEYLEQKPVSKAPAKSDDKAPPRDRKADTKQVKEK
jgi:hypothetical protein